jgi:glyoxylate reductase
MKKKIFMTYKVPGKFLDKLDDYSVSFATGVCDRAQLLNGVVGVSAIVCLLTDKIDAEVLDRAGSQLELVANYAVGYDNIDVDECTKRGVKVTNTPGVLTESVAEHVIALMYTLYRRVAEGDRYVRSGMYRGWKPDLLLGTSIKGKIMGIIGLGRIGRWTARMAVAQGMKVIYYSRHRDEEFEAEYDVTYHGLSKLMEMSDVVSISVPLCDETRNMIDKDEISLMKKTAILINTARGGVVNEKALIEALKNHKIAGAGVDVFEDENNPNKDFFDLHNVVLTPHIASATFEARLAMSRILVDNVCDVLSGRKSANVVNKI